MKNIRKAAALLLALLLLAVPALATDDTEPAVPLTGAASNAAPVAENLEFETYRGVSVGGSLKAYDADGDELTFELVTEPVKGSVEIAADGYFVYTPMEGKRGRDYFSYRAVDPAGNTSQEATVIIKLIKQSTKTTYADMAGNGAEYAAVVLTEQGLFTGETVGTTSMFNPDAELSRGEFLTMCMLAADCDLLQGVQSTGFQDDDAIGPWLKPYVATALMNGYIRGEAVETGAVFLPDEAITVRDACVLLNAVLGVTDVVSVANYYGEIDAPEAQAVANLTAAGVMLSRDYDLDAPLTRAQAAELLMNAINLLAKR
ncbi:MAG: Ig-like domain-containing protein [Oscillospiraceae bacterium]